MNGKVIAIIVVAILVLIAALVGVAFALPEKLKVGVINSINDKQLTSGNVSLRFKKDGERYLFMAGDKTRELQNVKSGLMKFSGEYTEEWNGAYRKVVVSRVGVGKMKVVFEGPSGLLPASGSWTNGRIYEVPK